MKCNICGKKLTTHFVVNDFRNYLKDLAEDFDLEYTGDSVTCNCGGCVVSDNYDKSLPETNVGYDVLTCPFCEVFFCSDCGSQIE